MIELVNFGGRGVLKFQVDSCFVQLLDVVGQARGGHPRVGELGYLGLVHVVVLHDVDETGLVHRHFGHDHQIRLELVDSHELLS